MPRNREVRYVELGIGSALQYWNEIAMPAVEVFNASASAATAIIASILTWHVHEWVWSDRNGNPTMHDRTAYEAFRDSLIDQCEELGWVRDIADASKHRALGRKGEVASVRRTKVPKLISGLGMIGTMVDGELGVELTDGSIYPLSAMFETITKFWSGRLGPA